MKRVTALMLFGFLILCGIVSAEALPSRAAAPDQDTTVVDSVKSKATHSAVNVVVETEWSDPETIKNVDVYVKYEKGIARTLAMKSKSRDCDIALISGVTVKILNPVSGKRIATYSGPKELPQKK